MNVLPQKMNAAYVQTLGPVENIRYGSLPLPTMGPTDVLVAVHAATVNPVDTFIRSGTFDTSIPLPFILGRDLVGTVVACGEETVGFAPGEWVWCNSLGHDGRQGSFSQYATVSSDRLYHLPNGVDPIQAVAVAHMAATAWLGLFRQAKVNPGETIFIGGGAGNVGTAAITLATQAGARVIASAHGEGMARCTQAGAEVVVDYRDPRMYQQVRRAAPGGVDVYWETSGHHNFAQTAKLMATDGRIIISAAPPFAHPELPVFALYTNNVDIRGFVISHATTAELAAAAQVINQKLLAGTLRARIAHNLPLSEASKAHDLMESGQVSSGQRLIVQP